MGLATTTSSDRGNIGTNNKTQTGEYAEDCYSNIYDFLGNCLNGQQNILAVIGEAAATSTTTTYLLAVALA